jgi:hypothetical protein
VADPLQDNTYCWGLTEEDAVVECFDNDLCNIDICQFGDEFEPWEGSEDPWFNPECTEGHPDWPNCDPKPSNVGLCKHELKNCDDQDKCTIDSCDWEMGCVHEFDFDSLACFGCLDDEYCADDDPCTMEYCDLDIEGCKYPQLSCDDMDDCTIDACSPVDGCQHVFDATLPCCGRYSICLTDDPSECDDLDECTTDFCDFPPGAECGFCKNVEMDCDDGDPETEEMCVDGGCVVV